MTRGYTEQHLAIIRSMAVDTPDHLIGERLGFNARKVAYIRQWNNIPPCNKTHWPEEKIEQIRKLYVDEGLPSSEVAALVGCAPSAIRRLKGRQGWYRDPAIEARNRTELNRRLGAARQGIPRALRQKPAPVAKPTQDLSKAPVVFVSKDPAFQEPLDRRILREIEVRALSAGTIATLIGEKELSVSMQLSALRHAGQVEADGEGRNKLWKAALYGLQEYTNRSESMGCGGAVTPAASLAIQIHEV